MTTRSPDPPDLPSFQLENFRFVSVLGRGGMGTVYLAEQLRPARPVAIKVVAPNPELPPAFVEALKNEGDVAARFGHDNLVHVYECGIVQGHYYLAMEYLGGGDLERRIHDGLEPDEVIRIIRAIASALGHIHERGYVHRDVKPSNILFTEANKPVLVDFGVAKAARSVGHLTSAGLSTGTPAYMSPEQIRGLELDGRTDLYSLGVVFQEALTGRLPFRGETAQDLQLAHLSDRPESLPDKISALQPLVSRLLEKNPRDRFADAASLVAALDGLAREGRAAIAPAPVARQLGLHQWARELYRRKVFRTLAVYAAAGWGFTEIATAALGAFGLPQEWGDWLVIAFIAAFPFVAALSWLYEVRGGGLARDQRRAPRRMLWWTAGAALLVALAILIPIIGKEPRTPPLPVKPFDLAIVRGQASGEDAGALLEGLVADLEQTLAARSDLRVFATEAAERLLAGDNRRALPVARLLEVSAQQVGDQIRLRVSMRAADSEEVLWTDVLDDRIEDFFELQDRLTQRLVPRLNATLAAEPETDKPNLDAYMEFQWARQRAAGGGRDNLLAALKHAKQAIAMDPAYAEAKALLGNLYLDLVGKYPIRDFGVRLELEQYFEEAAAIAIELGDRFPESTRLAVRLELASYRRHDERGWPPGDAVEPLPVGARLESAIARFPDAVALYPLTAFARLSAASNEPGRWLAERAAARDFLAAALVRHPAEMELALAHAAYTDEVPERVRRLVDAYPDQVLPLMRLGWAYYEIGSLARAAQHWSAAHGLDPETIAGRLNLLRVLIDLRAIEQATALVERYFDQTELEPEFYLLAAAAQMAAGEPDTARILLELGAERFEQAKRPMPCLAAVGEVWSGAPAGLVLELGPAQLARCDANLLQRFGDSLELHRALALSARGEADAASEILRGLAARVDARLRLRPEARDLHLRAALHAIGGETDAARAALDEAERQGWVRDWYSRWHPAFAVLRSDGEFDLLLRGIEARVNQQRRTFEADDRT